MTRNTHRAALVLAAAVTAALLAPVPGHAAAPRPTAVAATRPAGVPAFDRTYYSAPPSLAAAPAAATPSARASRPKPPRTRGYVTGQVVGPKGTPIRNALVTGVRFSDFGAPFDRTEEQPVVARTDGSGRFRLQQLTEGYLIRICSEGRANGGGHRASGTVPSGECDTSETQRFTMTYDGPDGRTDSYLRQTRLFTPQPRGRSIGRVVVQPSAVVAGAFKGGAHQTVYLTRINGSIAATTVTDRKGEFRMKAAPGPYRIQVDKDPGLRTSDTVPGYTSKRLVLRPGRTARLAFRARHAGIVRGQVIDGSGPLADQFVSILDADGGFAAGVVTDAQGRYSVNSLKPGTYFVTTSYAFGDHVPTATSVTISGKAVVTADLSLAPGASVSFTTPGNAAVDAELRNASGRVVKVYEGVPGLETGGKVVFSGLPVGGYTLYVRSAVLLSDTTVQTDFPWASRSVPVTTAVDSIDLGSITLDQPTIDLPATLPRGAQVKLTAVPEDVWLRPAYVDGDQATPMAVNWTEPSVNGAVTITGLVPGAYTTAVTTELKDRGSKPSRTGGDVATTHGSVTVTGPGPAPVAFSAPAGIDVRGTLVYAGLHRPAIAPYGVQLLDQGDRSWLFPTVSTQKRLGRDFVVERLHAGAAIVLLLDQESLFTDNPDLLIPDSLLASASNSEPGTPYWLSTKRRTVDLTAGSTLDLGKVPLKVHGLLGVHSALGRG